MKEIDPEKIKLTPYEEEIERKIEAGDYEPVENLEEWKRKLKEMARETKKSLAKKELTLKFESPEIREKAIEILREHLKEGFKVVENEV